MPCYLFTYHAYGSWLPDRRQGYVKRHRGVLPPDPREADRFRQRQRDQTVTFTCAMQHALIDELTRCAGFQRFTLHAVGSDPTHLHVLLSWHDDRPVVKLRTIIKSSLTRRLNRDFTRREWFSANASRKRVRDRAHFDYLSDTYLPDHRGVFWRATTG